MLGHKPGRPEAAAHSIPGSNAISEGVTFVSRVVSAVVIIKFALRVMKTQPSNWLAGFIKAYTDLFHPIVDYTIGLIPSIFGYAFLPSTRDLIVVNSFIASAVARAVIAQAKEHQRSSSSVPRWLQWIGVVVVCFLFWPALAFVTLVTGPLLSVGAETRSKTDPIFRAHWQQRSDYFLPLARKCRRELLIAFAIALIAIALNAAGEL